MKQVKNIVTREEIEEIRDYFNDKDNPKYKNFANDFLYVVALRLGIIKR